MATNATDPLIFPVARYVGERYDMETEVSTYDLRSGWKVTHLAKEERDIWGLAHGLTNRLKQGARWTRAAVLASAVPPMKDEVNAMVEALLERGVLVEVSPGTEQAVEFAEKVRLAPLQLGLGNSAEKPWLWRIGSPAGSIEVSEVVYQIWEWGHLCGNLWEACNALAKINTENYETPAEAEDCDPAAILTEVLNDAHKLLSAQCACFDAPLDLATA